MEENGVKLESIASEEFNSATFKDQVQSEIYRVLDSLPFDEKIALNAHYRPGSPPPAKLRPPPQPIGLYATFAATGILVGFLLARGTPLTLLDAIKYVACLLGVFLSIRAFLAYRERRANKARRAVWEKRRAEDKAKQRISQLMAEEIVDNPSIRKLLCSSLKSVVTDVFEISKVVTPVLTGAVIAGTIPIPLNPMLFAAIAIVIARSGVNTLCADFK